MLLLGSGLGKAAWTDRIMLFTLHCSGILGVNQLLSCHATTPQPEAPIDQRCICSLLCMAAVAGVCLRLHTAN